MKEWKEHFMRLLGGVEGRVAKENREWKGVRKI